MLECARINARCTAMHIVIERRTCSQQISTNIKGIYNLMYKMVYEGIVMVDASRAAIERQKY